MSFLRLSWRVAKLIAFTLFYGTPLVSFWVASSLTAYLNAPAWAACVVGLLVFPVSPLAWELRAYRRWKTKPRVTDERLFTLWQRLSLRILTTSCVFLGVLLYAFPRTAFVSLSARGDWMFDGVQGVHADRARRVLFAAADGLEWLYRRSSKNPYEAFVENQVDRAAELLPDSGVRCPLWPWKQAELHPAVVQMPKSEESTIESVARYIAHNETDPFLRIKALHDYVASRVAYDADSLYAGRYPRQDAQFVFERRLGVCAGYANLMAALGAAIHEKIVVVLGDARSPDGKELTGGGHAWNAALIGGRWYLMDVTWDAGTVSRTEGFARRYSTEYLFPPPQAMALDHIPREPRWQLLDRPLSQGDFLRQPMLRPAFFAEGLELLSPTRAQSDASGKAVLMVKNPHGLWLMLHAEQEGRRVGESTVPVNAGTALLECPLPSRGTYQVNLYMNTQRQGSYRGVGSLEFVNEG